MITQEIIDQLKAASAKATKGPWTRKHKLSYCHKEVVKAGMCSSSGGTMVNVSTGETTLMCGGHDNKNWATLDCLTYYEGEYIYGEDASFIALARNHIDALIERVEELESEERWAKDYFCKSVKLEKQVESLTAENEKMRSCLGFYADESVYKFMHSAVSTTILDPYVIEESGKKARSCLASLEVKP